MTRSLYTSSPSKQDNHCNEKDAHQTNTESNAKQYVEILTGFTFMNIKRFVVMILCVFQP